MDIEGQKPGGRPQSILWCWFPMDLFTCWYILKQVEYKINMVNGSFSIAITTVSKLIPSLPKLLICLFIYYLIIVHNDKVNVTPFEPEFSSETIQIT